MTTNFRRLFLPMAALMLLTIVFLGVAFHVFLYDYIITANEDTLYADAAAISDLAEAYHATGTPNQSMSFWMNLSFAARLSGTQTLICDESGQIVLCSEDIQGCKHVGHTIGGSFVDKALANGRVSSTTMLRNVYDQTRLAVMLPIRADNTESGQVLGFVISSNEMTSINASVQKTTRIFVMTALVVLLVALICISVLTQSQNRPLKEMAGAARQLGHGNLSVRVHTGGVNTREFDELAVAFNNMATSLQTAEARRQEFVANVSHELKTPMTTIAGYMDGMLDGTIPPQKHTQYMQIISSEVRRLSRLVRNMLEISRMQSQGIDESKKCKFDLCDSVGQVLLSFEQRINEKGLEVEVSLPDNPVYVYAEPDSITQVIYNLLDNAVKFCGDAGTLGVRVQLRGGKAYTSVTNTGVTISDEELPLVFDRFHKTDKSRSMDRDGAGLGLYIVKTIICSHGEDISVTSRDGKTEFTFTLPLAKREAAPDGGRRDNGRFNTDGTGGDSGI